MSKILVSLAFSLSALLVGGCNMKGSASVDVGITHADMGTDSHRVIYPAEHDMAADLAPTELGAPKTHRKAGGKDGIVVNPHNYKKH